jgi:hypothetical protein
LIEEMSIFNTWVEFVFVAIAPTYRDHCDSQLQFGPNFFLNNNL